MLLRSKDHEARDNYSCDFAIVTETWLQDRDIHWLNTNTLNQNDLKI